MSQKSRYKTVAGKARTLMIEKKSKFIASVMPVDNEEDALAFLNAVRSEFPDATHNVYAYVIDENNIFRYSDDGEPGGTAGMPVLDAIRKEGLVDTAVVVTRYFGGTLLGTGGLVHAYSQSAKQGLWEAGIVERVLCDTLDVCVDYTLSGKMQYIISSNGYILEDTVYDSAVTYKICVPNEDTKRVCAALTEDTNGRAEYKITGQKYINI